MDGDMAQLVVDEDLYLQALKTLTDLEDEGTPFEYLNALGRFAREDYLSAHFAVLVEREYDGEVERPFELGDADAISYYGASLYLVHHHRANIQQLPDLLESFEPFALAFIRMSAWSFVNAWNHRYGGWYAHRLIRPTLVDPTVDDAK